MAQLISEFPVIGRLGDFSAYRVKGSDKIYVRRKGGATKEKIRTDPAFAITRKLNQEFAGRDACFRKVWRALYPLKPLADRNVAGQMNKMLKVIQDLDVESLYGQRTIYLSRHGNLLEGFSINKYFHLDNMLSTPIRFNLSRETRKAEVFLPRVIPGLNFHAREQYSHYGFVLVLAAAPDMHWSQHGYRPLSDKYDRMESSIVFSDWFPTETGSSELMVTMELSDATPDDHHAMVLAAGIRFGSPMGGGEIKQVKYGSARLIGIA